MKSEITHSAMRNGSCGYCNTPIAGRFENDPGTLGLLQLPVRLLEAV